MKTVFYIPCTLVRFSYMQHLWRTAMVSNILGSLAVSSKCPWGDSRLQFLGSSFPWEDLSWPLRWLQVPSWGYHRLSLRWIQGAFMWTQFSPEVTSGYSWPWVALGWSQITRGTTRGHQRVTRYAPISGRPEAGLTWALLSVPITYVYDVSSVQ